MTDTDTKAKGPPAWMKREPLQPAQVIAALDRMALAKQRAAQEATDRDVKQGQAHQAATLSAIAAMLRDHRQPHTTALEHLEQMREARLGCARACTEPLQRATYMDGAHVMAEAIRHLKEHAAA